MRAVFGRWAGEQAWFPGSDPFFVGRDRRWLDSLFPVLKSRSIVDMADWPGRLGATFVRRIDAHWVVVHANVPPIAENRGVPRWTALAVPDADFRNQVVLASAVDMVRAAAGDPVSWLSTSTELRAGSWNDAALGSVAMFVEHAHQSFTESTPPVINAAALDAGGMAALQVLLCAAIDAGYVDPGAVLALEMDWVALPGASWPSPCMTFDSSEGVLPNRQIPSVRGVPIDQFVNGMRAAIEFAAIALRELKVGSVNDVGAAWSAHVPLYLINYSELSPTEYPVWGKACWSRSELRSVMTARLNHMVVDIKRGNLSSVLPFVHLASASPLATGVDRRGMQTLIQAIFRHGEVVDS
jgi:hypothetical protein